MIRAQNTADRGPGNLPELPVWLNAGAPVTTENAAFQVGAAFAMLDIALASRVPASQVIDAHSSASAKLQPPNCLSNRSI